MNKNQRGPAFPSPAETIDLSIDANRGAEDLWKDDACNVRASIRDYRHNVRCKMFAQSNGTITPWGVWKTGKEGLYEMQSSLNNRFIDTELSAPFLPIKEMEKTYPLMEEGLGVSLSRSIKARNKVRLLGRKHLVNTVRKPGSEPKGNDPLIRVRAVHPARFDLLDYCVNMADREVAFGCNESIIGSNNLLKKHAREKVAESKHQHCLLGELSKRNGESVWVDLSCNDLIPAPLTDFTASQPPRQWFFINLPTLAMLSCNFAIEQKEYERRWLFWSSLAGLAGLPCAVLSPHGMMTPNHPLSPCNMRFDPLFVILYGMWSLGAADAFSIHLALNHPNRALRGAYMGFQLGGEGNKRIMGVLDRGEPDTMLNHPITGDDACPINDQSLTSTLREAFMEGARRDE